MLRVIPADEPPRRHVTPLVILRHGQSIWNRDKKFTGWSDVPLSPKGEQEAEQAAYLLKQAGFTFDLCYSSPLQRARTTAQIVLSTMQLNIPIIESWRLNERHYGALESMQRWEAIKEFGIWPILGCQIKFDATPPYLETTDSRFPGNQPAYAHIDQNELPRAESLQHTLARVKPYWEKTIQPEISQGKRILIVSHRNTLRTFRVLLEHLHYSQVMKSKLATGRPLVYELDQRLKVARRYYIDKLN
ncbi:2,3-bisphosphoglycerate-dependent phosphoglycerate mutase [Nitrosomonas sp. JL21]|uniref:2,3-bisphosphoglycerate-dependent phosphoglycerate mutase n=1 Tax=Nitrosomonas sp. JL21 TaxID=153949 RepID=UPI00136A221C|nr:2,3-bisphosphoglycerate-dependent phosphoglycerate mutase [Nitrosomonas sp. JL21]MBL8497138.1 2,3-bisphosphoglycerate-dependent phosphoglycerate mutase [Nitrosomonas sp.]MCC7091470.1 2,3-bisphosphoglycerate-dependent phosphoglycerate mutase [Nitrosomonas sp.]MXS76608.1 2,3-bisphosphoglycerate-dependent phosphoglycerate mutase [Nitrosomonas sp. JL21]